MKSLIVCSDNDDDVTRLGELGEPYLSKMHNPQPRKLVLTHVWDSLGRIDSFPTDVEDEI